MDSTVLKDVINSIVDSFADDVRNTDSYKELFEKLDGNDYRALLRDLECKMESLALDAVQAIEDKFGKNITREQMDILYGLPLLSHRLEKLILKEHGSSCCVDKTFLILAKAMRDNERKEAP